MHGQILGVIYIYIWRTFEFILPRNTFNARSDQKLGGSLHFLFSGFAKWASAIDVISFLHGEDLPTSWVEMTSFFFCCFSFSNVFSRFFFKKFSNLGFKAELFTESAQSLIIGYRTIVSWSVSLGTFGKNSHTNVSLPGNLNVPTVNLDTCASTLPCLIV